MIPHRSSHNKTIPRNFRNSYSLGLFAKIASIVFFTELFIMVALSMADIHGYSEMIIDLLFLSITSSLLFFVFGIVQNVQSTKENLGEASEILLGLQNVAIVSMTDLEGKITYANELFCEISGYTKEELMGKDHRIINSGFHPKSYFSDMWNTIQSGKIWNGEIKNKKKNGEFYWVFSNVIPLQNHETKKIEKHIAIRFDITEKKNQELALNEAQKIAATAQKQMFHSEKLVTLGLLSSGVAHEINNPLLIIKGNADFLLQSLQNNICGEEEIDSVKKQLKSVDRISNIVNGLRTFARKDSDVISSADLNQATNEVLAMVKQLYQNKGIKFEISLNQKIPLVVGNQGKLEQIIMNLVSNAADATIGKHTAVIHIESSENNGHIFLRVKDNGNGITEANLKHIFDPFFTTKDPGKGTGLGLSIVYNLIKSMEGNIEVQSTVGVGTVFIISLMPSTKS